MTPNPSGWQAIARAIARAIKPRLSSSPRPKPSAPQEYPGDFIGRFDIVYDPHPDQLPDPGEVVWTWVPYEEDHAKGKDRPVVIVGRDDPWLLALPMTSKDHDLDAAQEASEGRYGSTSAPAIGIALGGPVRCGSTEFSASTHTECAVPLANSTGHASPRSPKGSSSTSADLSGHSLGSQKAPVGRATTPTVFKMMLASVISDQFST